MKPKVNLDDLTCLDDGHAWEAVDTTVATGALKGCPAIIKRCQTCGTTKRVTISSFGKILYNAYDHDPEYLRQSRELGSTIGERRYQYRQLRYADVIQDAKKNNVWPPHAKERFEES